MESKFQTSFIPKKSLDNKSGVKIKTPLNLLSIISLAVTIVVLVVAGGAFGYKTYLEKSLESKKQKLQTAEDTFDYAGADNVGRIDAKLNAAGDLLNTHTAISNFFSYLEASTLQRLRFSEFTFSAISKDRMAVIMKGQAKSFEVVAKQSEAFSEATKSGEVFANPIFSNLDLDLTGNITFSFLASVNPKMLLYKNKLVDSGEVQPAAEEPEVPAVTESVLEEDIEQPVTN